MNLRVGIDVTPVQTGHRYRGIGSYVLNLVSQLIKVDVPHQFYLVAYKGLPLPWELPLGDNAHLIWLSRPRLGRASALLSHQIYLPLLISKLHLDLFHYTFVSSNLSTPGISLWRPAIKNIVTLYDVIPLKIALSREHSYNRLFYRWQLMIAQKCDHIITLSQSARQDIISCLGCSPEQVSSIPLAANPALDDIEEDEYLSPPNGRYILHVGGDFLNKNLETLFQAYVEVYRAFLERGERIYLVLIGSYQQPDDELHKKYGPITEFILRYTNLPKSGLFRFYKKASAFAFPSTIEGFGLPPLEAMTYGVPVVASNASSLPEILGEAALYIDPKDIKSLSTALIRVLSDSGLAEDLSRRGKLQAARFSWQETAQKTLQLYENVCNAPR